MFYPPRREPYLTKEVLDSLKPSSSAFSIRAKDGSSTCIDISSVAAVATMYAPGKDPELSIVLKGGLELLWVQSELEERISDIERRVSGLMGVRV